jgi:hypothetical protein
MLEYLATAPVKAEGSRRRPTILRALRLVQMSLEVGTSGRSWIARSARA